MKYLTFAIGCALLCSAPVLAQDAVVVEQPDQNAAVVVQQPDTTVVVQDPDPATPAIQQTTTTTRVDHTATVTPSPAPRVVHHPVYHQPVHRAAAYHRPVKVPVKSVQTTDTKTTTQTTVTVPPHKSSTVVSEGADGSVSVTSDVPPPQGSVVVPADTDDDQH